MGTIVAIGGGEFRKGGTRKMDEYIISKTGKKHPKVLFIPTASSDAENYTGSMKAYISDLKCGAEVLWLIKEKKEPMQIRQSILQADIIYAGGGNAALMMEVWKKHLVDVYLREAFDQGVILCGSGTGSIGWFRSGYSAHRIPRKKEVNGGGWCDGLGLLPFYYCPHYDEPIHKHFDYAMEEREGAGLALEKDTALLYNNGQYELMKTSGRRFGYLINQEEEGIIKRKLKDASLLNTFAG